MNAIKNTIRPLLLVCLLLSTAACGPSTPSEPSPTATAIPEPAATATPEPVAPTAEPTATATATPAPAAPQPPTPTPPSNPCSGASGQIEVRVLVGPADAVGLEPVAVGTVPYTVSTVEAPYLIQGAGPISYADILVEQWGTYEVTMDLQLAVSGECVPGANGAQLLAVVDMTGEQLVKVESEGFQGEYPWAGSHSLELTFPLEEGATAQGEGWTFVLHPLGG